MTLGINYSQMHDSSACIVRDGELLFAVAEERLSRVKHDSAFPRLAVQACLEFAGVSADQLDEVCFGWPHAGASFRHDLKCFATGRMRINYSNVLNSSLQFLSMWHQRGGAKRFTQAFGKVKARMRYVDHHLAHAISAYAYSGFENSAVVVMDGRGAWEATSIWRGHDGRLEHVLTIPFPNSVGYFFSEITEFLGFQRNSDEWKVMGLAPYGRAGVDLSSFMDLQANPYRVHTGKLIAAGADPFAEMQKLLGPKRLAESEITDQHKNIAYAAQEACEIAMMNVVRLAMQKTGSRNLCMAGGVALNSKANGKIAASGMVDNLFVQPAASDDGVALGAALAPYLDSGGKLPRRAMRHAYLGPAFDDEAIETVLRIYKLRYSRLENVALTVAELLADWKNHWLVSGTHGVWPSRIGQPFHPRGSPRPGNERQSK